MKLPQAVPPQARAPVCGGGAAQDGSHPRNQFVDAVGLGDVVVGSDLEANNGVELGRLGGHHDYRDRRVGADRATNVDARQAGEHHIEKNKVGLVGREPLECLYPVARDGYEEALPLEVHCQRVHEGLFILDDENSRREVRHAHRLRPCRRLPDGSQEGGSRPYWRDVSCLAWTSQVRDVPVRWRVLSFGGAGE